MEPDRPEPGIGPVERGRVRGVQGGEFLDEMPVLVLSRVK